MAIDQDVIVLHDFGAATVEERRRTTSAGTKSRYSRSIKAEPVLHDFNGVRLGKIPAQAIADLLRRQVRAIMAVAAPATLARRKRAKAELEKGEPGAVRRYSGGRTGTKEPAQTVRMFNDSGRLAEGIEVRENLEEQAWNVNVTNNRFTPDTFRGGAFERMMQRLGELAPAFRGGAEILRDESVRKAIAEATANAIYVAKEGAVTAGNKALATIARTVYSQLLKPLLLG